MIDTLLQTKLFIPPTPGRLVARPHLLARLNDGLSGKLTLVAAPAGFGKTTLVTNWIDSAGDDRRFCWLGLDADDNDVAQFFRYVAAALQPLAASPLLLTQMSNAEQAIAAKSWAHALINDALAVKRPFALVLDDYHAIHTPDIHDALNVVLAQMPPHMHLVITSRADPNLNIARLRARRQLTEIRAADLRLSAAEMYALTQQLDLPITEAQAALLNERTEGWVAGLQLAALAMQSHTREHNLDDFIRTFAGSHRFVMDYLTDEVLRGQPLDVESFLLQTAVLDRFNSELCTAVLNDPRLNAADMLGRLEQANLFLVPLDGERRWYRYHHLFADLLRQRLRERFAADHIAVLHQRAAAWLAERDFVSEALNHSAVIGRWEAVAEAIARLATEQINSGNANLVRTWLNRLPDNVVRGDPRLAIDKAWLIYMRLDMPALLPYLAIAETKTDDPGHVGETVILRALYQMTNGDVTGAVAGAAAANARLDERYPAQKGGLYFLLGNGYDILNRVAERGEAFAQAVAYLERGGNWVGYSGALALLIRHHWSAGNLNEAYRLGQQFVSRFESDGRLQHGGGAQAMVFHALIIFERHDAAHFAKAEEMVTRALELTRLTMSRTAIDVWMLGTLVLMKLARGVVAEARSLATQVDEALSRLPGSSALFGYYEFVIQLHLLLGQPAAAERWIAAFEATNRADDDPASVLNNLHRVEATLQRGQFDTAWLAAARERVTAVSQKQSPSVVQMRALVVLALVEHNLGNRDAALAALEQAVNRAAPQQWVALFRFPGDDILHLLRALSADSLQRAFCQHLLTVLSPAASANSVTLTMMPDGHILEPLSDRELELLRLVAAGHTSREIANKLYLAVGTVKRHLSNINGKLQTSNRTQAVARARELNLL